MSKSDSGGSGGVWDLRPSKDSWGRRGLAVPSRHPSPRQGACPAHLPREPRVQRGCLFLEREIPAFPCTEAGPCGKCSKTFHVFHRQAFLFADEFSPTDGSPLGPGAFQA